MSIRANEWMSLRMDEALKKDFEVFCGSIGLTVSGAVVLLANETIKQGKIPFNVLAFDEIRGVVNGHDRQSKRMSVRIGDNVKKDFSEICDQIGIPMSTIVRMFMIHCVNKKTLPF